MEETIPIQEKKQWVRPELKQEEINVEGGPHASSLEDPTYSS